MAEITPAAAAPFAWHITKTHWTEADEKDFGDFIRAIAESGCTTTAACMRSSANPYRDSDSPSLVFHADCAKWVYMLRAYYASKHGLPFSYVDKISGSGTDIRFSSTSNQALSRHDLVDGGGGIPTEAALKKIHDLVWSATYRMDAAKDGAVMSDFYSPKIQPGSIRAGTAIYDINGHVGVVYGVAADGRILYMDAHPDESVSRSVYGPQFGQSPVALGGGFKNFRPLSLVGASTRPDGSLTGGHIVLAADAAIADFSLEQYRGNASGGSADGPNAQFVYNGAPLGLFEYARASMSGGNFAFNPAYELEVAMQSLCHEVKERAIHVDMAAAKGISHRAEPAALTGAGENPDWDAYATEAIDARLRNSFATLYSDMERMIALSDQGDMRIVRDRGSLLDHLREIYDQQSHGCAISYANSENRPVSLSLDDVAQRLFAIDFDPYHCVERRWGASDPKELASCKDDTNKTSRYQAEQPLRNRAESGYVAVDVSLAPRTAGLPPPAGPPHLDVKSLLGRTS